MVSSGKDEKNSKEQKRRQKLTGTVSKEETRSKKKREMKRRGEESNVGTLKQSNTIKITFLLFYHNCHFFFFFSYNVILISSVFYLWLILFLRSSFFSVFTFLNFFFVGWTAVTMDGSRSAQFEHTMLVTESGVEILTGRVGQPTDRILWDAECFKRWGQEHDKIKLKSIITWRHGKHRDKW